MEFTEKYTVPLKDVVKEFGLRPVYEPENIDQILIERSDASRPALPLTGFFQDFEPTRIQLIGNMEYSYLESLSKEDRYMSLKRFFEKNVVAVIVTSDLDIFDDMRTLAEQYKTPLYSTEEFTSVLLAAMTASLNVQLAERISIHGVLVEVYGEGILIRGESGIGKSETAIELVKRGHRLIADDMVEIKRVSAKSLVGSAPELTRHYIELRGIGVVDIRRLFGMGSVKLTEKIDFVVNLEMWDPEKMYERLGLDQEYTDILGIKVPCATIPVKPGRNLAIVLEIAAMNNRQKKMGYNTAEELTKKLMEYTENKSKSKK